MDSGRSAPKRAAIAGPAGSVLGTAADRPEPGLPDLAAAVPAVAAGRFRITGAVLAVADVTAAVVALAVMVGAGVPLTVAAVVLVALAAVVGGALSGFYHRTAVRLQRTHLPEVAQLLQMGLLVAVVLVAVGGRPLTAGQTGLATCALVGLVGLTRHVLYALADTRAACERCVLIGSRDLAEVFERRLRAAGTSLDIVEQVELDRVGDTGTGRTGVEELIARHGAHRVIVLADGQVDAAAQAARRARNAGATVTVVPRVTETLGAEVVPEMIGGCVAFSAGPAELSPSQAALKRAFDLAGAGTALAVVGPFMLLIAVLIRTTSDGPVLFRQRRIGRDGREIRILKFRTMVADAEALKASLLDRNEAGDGLFKIVDDPRITGVGRFLRRTSLDELPQLLNVLAGDMSLVGPRPLIADEDGRIDGWHRDRLRLAPGMTGLWQVMGSARIGLDDMVLLDHHYVSNWSLWKDVQVLVRTAGVVLTRRGM